MSFSWISVCLELNNHYNIFIIRQVNPSLPKQTPSTSSLILLMHYLAAESHRKQWFDIHVWEPASERHSIAFLSICRCTLVVRALNQAGYCLWWSLEIKWASHRAAGAEVNLVRIWDTSHMTDKRDFSNSWHPGSWWEPAASRLCAPAV